MMKVISRIKDNDFNSWVKEWAKIADQVAAEATGTLGYGAQKTF